MRPDEDGSRSGQRLAALARANHMRAARARLKRRIAAGEISCVDLLLRPCQEIDSMPIAALLATQRYWGEQRARQLLRSFHISELKPIGTMTERQRRAIVAELSRRTSPTSPADDAGGSPSGLPRGLRHEAPCR
jgi:hypothetical protein